MDTYDPRARFFSATPVPKAQTVYLSQASSSLIGNGSPEGVVSAFPGTTYFDKVGPGYWVKVSGNARTGWSAIISR